MFVENVDILDRTPILDIKAYVSQFDAVEEERTGWLTENIKVSEIKRNQIIDFLNNPALQNNQTNCFLLTENYQT